MVILVTGASHTGKTLLAQRLPENTAILHIDRPAEDGTHPQRQHHPHARGMTTS